MPEKYSDEKYKIVLSRLQEREKLIKSVANISRQIADLMALRDEARTAARRLKSAAIAWEVGVSQSWVEKISERKIKREINQQEKQ